MTAADLDDLQAEAAAFGIDPGTLGDVATEDPAFSVYPENWPALNVFLALANAWVLLLPAMGGKPLWRGIPRVEIAAMLQLMGLWAQRADILPRLLVLEAAALERLNADG